MYTPHLNHMQQIMDFNLVFLPMPEIGHLLSMVQLANRLIHLNNRFTATILVPTAAFGTTAPLKFASSAKLRFINLPAVHSPELDALSGVACYSLWAKLLKPIVKHAIITHAVDIEESGSKSGKLTGFVFDMMFTAMTDVAAELGVAFYVYFPSSAAMLGLLLQLPTYHAEENPVNQPEENPTELRIPSFADPVPFHILPSFMSGKDQEGYRFMLDHARRYKETKGIILNTLPELESGVLDLDLKGYPPVYPVGPLLAPLDDPKTQENGSYEDRVVKWLDSQESTSVIFLCFGSRGAFGVAQVQEIAYGLENSGCPFLWSLRRPPTANHDPPSDYARPEDILPEGFIDRTSERGLVCGWAPQRKVLAHRAIGGFVSHCGWNSSLESVWWGVPILAWPIFAEQKLNAYRLVKELGLGVVIREDFLKGVDLLSAYLDGGDLVTRDEVERGVNFVMNGDSRIRMKVKKISEKCRKAVKDDGSSLVCLKLLIEDKLINN